MRMLVIGCLALLAATTATTAHAQDAGAAAANQAIQQSILAQQASQQATAQQQAAVQQSLQQGALNQQIVNDATRRYNPCPLEVCFVATPAVSLAKGTYSGAQTVALTSRSPDAVIYYTTDGSAPTRLSHRYTQPLTISATTRLRAVAVVPTYAYSSIKSVTYKVK
jgi:type II secretory pathway pseudopilin PulG